MTHQNNSNFSVDMLGILSCISDIVIVYKKYKVLFANAEGHLLLEQTQRTILNDVQFEDQSQGFHQFELILPDTKEHLIAHCLHTPWEGEQAKLTIIKTKREYSNLLVPAISAEDAHLQNRNRLDLLFKSAGDGYWDWYIPTASVYFSEGWKQMLGYSPSDIEPSFKSWINLIHPDDLGKFLIVWSDYMDNTEEHFSIEYRILCKNSAYLWVEAHGVKELNSEGDIVRLAGFHRDISARKQSEAKILDYQNNLEQLVTQRTQELKQANLKLEHLASQDPLTRLNNRRSFNSNLDKQLRAAKRNNSPLCMLLMDIDHFKSINDEYGHQQGDTCLKAVATAIKNSLFRPTDIAARYGGEEFVILLQDTDIQGGIKVAQNIQRNIDALKGLPLNPASQKPISVSIGIASNHQAKGIDILDLADKAMYEAKNKGRNRICYYSKDLKSVSCLVNSPITELTAKPAKAQAD